MTLSGLTEPTAIFVTEDKLLHVGRYEPHTQTPDCLTSGCEFIGVLVPPGMFVNHSMIVQIEERART